MAVNIYVPLMEDRQFEVLCKYLVKKCNFEEMPELLWIEGSNPKVKKEPIWKCDNTLKHTIRWLATNKVERIRANVEKLFDLGAKCDCEVLFNAAPKWKEARHQDITGPDYMEDGQVEWDERVDDLIYDAWCKIKVKGKSLVIPGWNPRVIWDRDDTVEEAVNALKDKHIIWDIDDVMQELKNRNIEMSRNCVEQELAVYP